MLEFICLDTYLTNLTLRGEVAITNELEHKRLELEKEFLDYELKYKRKD